MASRRRIWFFTRMIVYLVVVVVLLLTRGGLPWRRLTGMLRGAGRADRTLTISGRDLAPALIDRLVAFYRQDYPDLAVVVSGGGTNQALEDLLDGRAGAAFLFRRPAPGEEDLFRRIDGDTAIVTSVAVAGVILLAGVDTDAGPVALDDVRRLLSGDAAGRCDRCYVPDPNEGLWGAVRAALALDDSLPPAGSPVVFLADARTVVESVGRDGRAWGIVSSLNVPFDPDTGPPPDVRLVPLLGGEAGAQNRPVLPTYENVATGDYPLHHELYVACRENGDREGGMFLTHLATARGLRQVERAGVVPARLIARKIRLTTTPVGE